MDPEAPHVVIVGAGFGGLRAVRALARAPVRVTLVDRHNYHLFQPLLYQVAMAGLAPEDIARPIRTILRRQENLSFRLAEVTSVDAKARRIETTTGPLDYDHLILAIGGTTNFFGLDSLEANGLPMKELDHAVAIRSQVLRMFELADQEPDPDMRRSLLTFVIVGGGPTGVEMAGSLSELIRLVLSKDFGGLDTRDVRILLLEATKRILTGFPEKLGDVAAELLWRRHVEVRFGSQVVRFDGRRVELQSGERIPCSTLIWAAGVRAAALADRLGVEQAHAGRIVVRPTLQLPEHPEVFVIGDAAYMESGGEPLPMMAPVALQQGRLAARNVVRAIRGEALQEFAYRDPGSLATIGRNAAVARIGRFESHGFAAWVIWLVYHLIQLIGFRNRLVVLISWAWDYFFYERSVRLISSREVFGKAPETK